MELDPSAGGPFESYWPDGSYATHEADAARASGEALRHPKPAPDGIQDYIVKDMQSGYQGCFDRACRLLNPKTKRPVTTAEQKRLQRTTTENQTQPWCVGSRGVGKDGLPKFFTTFEECCRAYHNGEMGTTSLKVPKVCDELWDIDYTYYANQQTFAEVDPPA